MKFLAFADFHHSTKKTDEKGTYRSFMFGEDDQLQQILDHAEQEKVDFIIHAGDFMHRPSQNVEMVEKYNNFHIPTYHCLGNHDQDGTPYEEVLKLYNMPDGHYYFDCEGYRMIVADPNYCKINDEYIHYDMGNYFKTPEARDWMPPEQLEWLKETIESSPYPCLIIAHSSFERADGIHNKDEVVKIINDANKKRPHSVLMVMNGHHHRDFVRIMDGVLYFEINSTQMDYMPKKHNLYPQEIVDKFRSAPHCVFWTDPIHAIITIEGTTITCEGMESDFFMGIRREDTENSIYDKSGRPTTAKVSSFKITL